MIALGENHIPYKQPSRFMAFLKVLYVVDVIERGLTSKEKIFLISFLKAFDFLKVCFF